MGRVTHREEWKNSARVLEILNEGVKKNVAQLIYWFGNAKFLGSEQDPTIGFECARSDHEAVALWQRAAALGHSQAKYGLGLAAATIQGNREEAVEWFEKSTERCDCIKGETCHHGYYAGGPFELGEMYYHGNHNQSDKPDLPSALRWYQAGAAQDDPCPDCLLKLARSFHGRDRRGLEMVGGTRDFDRARALYEQAASSRIGSAEAAYMLGCWMGSDVAAYMLALEARRDEDEVRYLELALCPPCENGPQKYDWQVRVLAHYELGLHHETSAELGTTPAQIRQHKEKALHHYHCAAEEDTVDWIPVTCSYSQAQYVLERIYTARCTCSTQAYQLQKTTHHARVHTFTH